MAVAANDIDAIVSLMGEKFTMNRLAREPIGAEKEENENKAAEAKSKSPAAEQKASKEKPLDEMSVKELISMCEAMGIKVTKAGRNKQYYIEKLRAKGLGEETSEKPDDEAEPGLDWEDEPETDPYKGKSALELYNMCKERGLDAEKRKLPSYYVGLLKASDEETDETDDEWGEVEQESKKKKATNMKAAAKAKSEPEDSGDDWDI